MNETNEAAKNIKKCSLEEDISGHSIYIKNRSLREFYELQMPWSWVITLCIMVLILAQISFVICLGLDWLDLTKYKIVLTIFYIETCIQITALTFIVAKFLFRDKK
ncbi:MAG: hypothetical protein LBL71_01660 [Endomicrobium sp.]|jgi:hypothetical protein|nr:hypothetical protein [Endomicrobium sp.]